MILKNFSQKTDVSLDLKLASSFSDKLLGLLKSSTPRSLMFKTRFGIHTFFLKKSIEVIVLANTLKVVKMGSVLPNRLFFWNPKFNIVIELPEGTLKKSNTKLGDILILLTKKAS